MELIDEIMQSIDQYCTDSFAVNNILYTILDHYQIAKKTTAITEYRGDNNMLLVKKFLVAKKIKGCTDRTLQYYSKEIPKALERIGKPVIDIKPDDIRILIAYRMREVSKATCNNELRCIRTFCAWLNAEEYIPTNPTLNINTIKQNKTQKEAFTDVEIVKMRSNLKDSRDKAIFELLVSTGCRVSELVQIKNEEIENDKITVHGKGQKDRKVYLNAAAQYALWNYQNERQDVSVWLFPKKNPEVKFGTEAFKGHKWSREWWKNPDNLDIRNHMDKGTVEDRIRTLGKKLDIKAYPHKFRRTCATNALRAGMPIEMVSRMLGHEQISTTQIYLDLNEEDLQAMHQKFVR